MLSEIGASAKEHVTSREELQASLLTARRKLKSTLSTIHKFSNRTVKEFAAYIQEKEHAELANLTSSIHDALEWIEEEGSKFRAKPKKELLEVKAADVLSRESKLGRQVSGSLDRLKWTWKSAQLAAQKGGDGGQSCSRGRYRQGEEDGGEAGQRHGLSSEYDS